MLYQSKNPHGGDIYSEPITLDFSANTNPFGTPQGVIDAVRSSLGDMHRYPDPYCRKLVQAISEFEQVPKSYILCGNGAAELIYAYCEAVKPKRALELAPTFSEYSLGLQRVDCQIRRYPLSEANGFSLGEDFLDCLWAQKPDVVFLCNPNNPTGEIICPQLFGKIVDFCREEDTLLFVDECFLDLTDSGESLKQYLSTTPQLFLLKAFTKSYGMAGIRLGYCMCANEMLLAKMAETVQPWNVSSLAQTAGIAALQEQPFLRRTKDLVRQERPWLKSQLEGFGFRVCPSETNFLLFHGPEHLHAALKRQAIAIRNCDNYHGLGPGWYRIAVRLHHENQALIQAISKIVEEV